MMFGAGLRGAVALALVMQMPTSSTEEITACVLFIIFWTNVSSRAHRRSSSPTCS
jgi:NhaP-type Na+/H+ or K+/H+ antiporter